MHLKESGAGKPVNLGLLRVKLMRWRFLDIVEVITAVREVPLKEPR